MHVADKVYIQIFVFEHRATIHCALESALRVVHIYIRLHLPDRKMLANLRQNVGRLTFHMNIYEFWGKTVAAKQCTSSRQAASLPPQGASAWVVDNQPTKNQPTKQFLLNCIFFPDFRDGR